MDIFPKIESLCQLALNKNISSLNSLEFFVHTNTSNFELYEKIEIREIFNKLIKRHNLTNNSTKEDIINCLNKTIYGTQKL